MISGDIGDHFNRDTIIYFNLKEELIMKSKRVTRLLACALATTMCAVPVFASSADPTTSITQDNYDGSVDLDFGKESINVQVSVPTSAALRVNPMATVSSGATAVTGAQIASRDLRIINRTYARTPGTVSNNQGVAVIVTARAQVLGKGDGVKVVYNKANAGSNVFSQDSDAKNVMMELQQGTLSDISGNGTYGSGAKATVTELGSRIKFAVGAPTSVSSGDNVTVADASVGKAAMAILGEATINAAWQTDDLNVGLVYNIKASNSTVTDTQPTLAGVTGNTITIPAATLNEATVEAVAIQDPKKDTYGFFPLEFDETTYTTNASGAATLTIDSGVIDYLKADDSLKGASNPQDLIIALSDGRVIVTTLTVS